MRYNNHNRPMGDSRSTHCRLPSRTARRAQSKMLYRKSGKTRNGRRAAAIRPPLARRCAQLPVLLSFLARRFPAQAALMPSTRATPGTQSTQDSRYTQSSMRSGAGTLKRIQTSLSRMANFGVPAYSA